MGYSTDHSTKGMEMTKPITLIQDADREAAARIRAVQVIADDETESWELELLATSSNAVIATDSYSVRAPSERDDILDLISYVLTSAGLKASPSDLMNSSEDPLDFTLYVSQL